MSKTNHDAISHLEENAEKLGLPQLDFSTYVSQVFWFGVCFSILFIFCKKYFIPRILTILKNRDSIINKSKNSISKNDDFANKKREKLDKMKKDNQEKSNEIIANAEKDAMNLYELEMSKVKKRLSQEVEDSNNKIKEKEIDINQNKVEILKNSISSILLKMFGADFKINQTKLDDILSKQ
jgi:F-type H+-transporting ATPase subunit b